MATITMLRIEKCSDGQATMFRLSGRIQFEHLEELRTEIEGSTTPKTILDMEEVTLVGRAVVHFLILCESAGIGLLNCPLYVREWIRGESDRLRVEIP